MAQHNHDLFQQLIRESNKNFNLSYDFKYLPDTDQGLTQEQIKISTQKMKKEEQRLLNLVKQDLDDENLDEYNNKSQPYQMIPQSPNDLREINQQMSSQTLHAQSKMHHKQKQLLITIKQILMRKLKISKKFWLYQILNSLNSKQKLKLLIGKYESQSQKNKIYYYGNDQNPWKKVFKFYKNNEIQVIKERIKLLKAIQDISQQQFCENVRTRNRLRQQNQQDLMQYCKKFSRWVKNDIGQFKELQDFSWV